MTALVLIGAGELAHVALSLLRDVEGANPVGCAVDPMYVDGASLGDLPVVSLDEIELRFPSAAHEVLVCVGYRHVNRERERLIRNCEGRGYRLWSLIHPHAWVSPEAIVGAGCIVFPRVVIEPYSTVGKGVVLWSGSVVAHDCRVGEFGFLAPNATLGGRVALGARCFVGANATVRDSVTVGDDCVIGAGAVIKRDAFSGSVYPAFETALGTRGSGSYDNL
ncbi:MAG: acetyltransferase [Actinobacteria bacterium]|nr:acetyltransferase [Actinomycetota bacterium]